MVILHIDNPVYSIDKDSPEISKKLQQFYHLKFEKLLKSQNIPYKLVDYENYSGDYFVGRFAHNLDDKELHSKCFDKLYNHYGENMWPNKKAYYYYDDKVRQYELLEKYGIQVPSVTCNNLDELLKNVTVGMVIKSTYGAGSESTFYVWEKEHLDNIEEYISNCYNSENFFPCQIQEYIDVEYELQIFFSNNETYGYKVKRGNRDFSPLSFPNPIDTLNQHWAKKDNLRFGWDSLKKEEFNFDIIDKLYDIKNKLNTPNIKFDLLNNKITEFTYMYGEMLPGTKSLTYDYYNFDKGIFDERVISINDFAYKQPNSVLKHLGIIDGDEQR